MDEKTRIAAVLDALEGLRKNPEPSDEEFARIERLRAAGHEPLAPNCAHSDAGRVFRRWECAPCAGRTGPCTTPLPGLDPAWRGPSLVAQTADEATATSARASGD